MSDQPPETPIRERPLGVTIIAVLAAIGGAVGVLGALAAMSVLTSFGGLAGSIGGFATIVVFIALGTAVVSLVFAYGAWTLQPWAWTLGVVLEVISGITALYQLADGQSSAVITVAIAAVILWYLFQPQVKAAFGQT